MSFRFLLGKPHRVIRWWWRFALDNVIPELPHVGAVLLTAPIEQIHALVLRGRAGLLRRPMPRKFFL
jgi:hypothetical protein